MAAMRAPRAQVGSTAWIIEERNAALQIAQSEVEEFSYSARNELDWLNEHMASIFNENETYACLVERTLAAQIPLLTNCTGTSRKHSKPQESSVERRSKQPKSKIP